MFLKLYIGIGSVAQEKPREPEMLGPVPRTKRKTISRLDVFLEENY